MTSDLKQREPRAPHRTACCLVILAIGGCNAKPQMELSSVTGTVLLDDQPLRAGTIITTPERGRGAQGTIDSTGHFTLSTRGVGDGAAVGSHQVAVIVTGSADSKNVNPEAVIKLTIPSRYAQAASSGLVIDVLPSQPNEVTLKLTSDHP